jgi:hypothetical protein
LYKKQTALELEEHTHHHLNLGAVHIDDTPPHAKTFHIEMPTNLGPETIAGICVKVVHVQHGILSDDERVAFLEFRDYLTLVARLPRRVGRARKSNSGFEGALYLRLLACY